MDPKMDSGFMLPEKDALVDNFDPLNPLLPEEIIGIMDQMLCYEVCTCTPLGGKEKGERQ